MNITAAPYIALFLSVISLVWQAYTFHRSTKLNLYQHRFAIFNIVQKMFKVFYKNHELKEDEIEEFRHATDHSNFLFGGEIVAHLNTILGAAVRLRRDLEDLRRNEKRALLEWDKTNSLKSENAILEDRIRQVRVRLRVLLENETNPLFYPYLNLHNALPFLVRMDNSINRYFDRWERILETRRT